MAVKNRMSAKDRANEVFKPSPKETNKAKLSNFFPKDDIFNKTKTYRLKGENQQVQSLDAEWRNIALNGKKIVLIKDNAVSKADLKHFSKEAKAYYLDEKKAKAPTAAEKKAAAEAAALAAADENSTDGDSNVD